MKLLVEQYVFAFVAVFVAVFVTAFLFALNIASATDTRSLVLEASDVVSVVPGAGNSVRMITRGFKGFTIDAKGNWVEFPMKIQTEETRVFVRRILHVAPIGENVLMAVGQVIHELTSGDASTSILRSTDGGVNWKSVPLGKDTLAYADGFRLSEGQHVFFLDGVGRYWFSNDLGLTWGFKLFPKQIQPGAVLELDMVSPQMGVCLDRFRGVHFTVDAWQSIIKPQRVEDLNYPVQPLLHNQISWNREFFMWDNSLYMTDGRDVFVSGIDKVNWRRWDTVFRVAMCSDRSAIVYLDIEGRVWSKLPGGADPVLLASNVSLCNLLDFNLQFVSAYSADTGPQLIRNGSSNAHRPYTTAKPISPTDQIITFKSSQWMAKKISTDAAMVDVYSRPLPNGEWIRDTVLQIGSKEISKLGNDSLLIGGVENQLVYNVKTRSVTPYKVVKPLSAYLKSPTASIRVLVARDGDDSTHVKWCDYRLQGNLFRCAEIVDSSKFGVKSESFFHDISKAQIDQFLQGANEERNRPPTVKDISYSESDVIEIKTMLDTVFMYDAYLDTLDLYRTPPNADVHARLLRSDFSNIVERISRVSDQELLMALQSWRRWPTDDVSKYHIEFQNQSGNLLVMKLERNDEAHPPLLMPWILSYGSSSWLWYSRKTAALYSELLAKKLVPELFTEMSRTAWYFAAIASYYDATERGRYHRWLSRKVVPEYAD
ncbi:MAG: hypothetical protein HQ472_06785 [Ignavibacteria bacterium]|nr:hypothetical protein [Ignavibacteria bacterium]